MVRHGLIVAFVAGAMFAAVRTRGGDDLEGTSAADAPSSKNQTLVGDAPSTLGREPSPRGETNETSKVPEDQAGFLAEVIVLRQDWSRAKDAERAKAELEAVIKDAPIPEPFRHAPLTHAGAIFFSSPAIYSEAKFGSLLAWLDRAGLVMHRSTVEHAGRKEVEGTESIKRFEALVRFPHEIAQARRISSPPPAPLVETKLEWEWTVVRADERDEYAVQLSLQRRERARGAADFVTSPRPLYGDNLRTFKAPPGRVVVAPARYAELVGSDSSYVQALLVLYAGPRSPELPKAAAAPALSLPERVLAGPNDVQGGPPDSLFASPFAAFGSGAGGWVAPSRYSVRPRSGGPQASSPGPTTSSKPSRDGNAGSAPATEGAAPPDALAAYALERELQSLRTAEQLRERRAGDPQANRPETQTLESQLRQDVESAFDARQRHYAARIAEFEEQLTRARRTYEERAGAREAIVRKRVDELHAADAPRGLRTTTPVLPSPRPATDPTGDVPSSNPLSAGSLSTEALPTGSSSLGSSPSGSSAPNSSSPSAPANRGPATGDGAKLLDLRNDLHERLDRYRTLQAAAAAARVDRDANAGDADAAAKSAKLESELQRAREALEQWRATAATQSRLDELLVRELEAAETYWRNQLEVTRKLFEKSAASRSEVDQATASLAQANARAERARVLLDFQRKLVEEANAAAPDDGAARPK